MGQKFKSSARATALTVGKERQVARQCDPCRVVQSCGDGNPAPPPSTGIFACDGRDEAGGCDEADSVVTINVQVAVHINGNDGWKR
jgi:hypothetical protein